MRQFSPDDLPDHVKKVIEDMLSNLSIMNPEDLMKIFGQVFGNDIVDQIEHLFQTGGAFSFVMDEHTLRKFDEILKQIEDESLDEGFYNLQEEIEPYYEITQPLDNVGEIIVEMPGITSLDQIEWYELEDEIYLYTIDGIEMYKLIIPVPKYFKIKEDEVVLRNGLFIIPYTIAE